MKENNNRIYRNKQRNFVVTEDENNNISKYAGKLHLTDSDFIRQAIEEKIMRIEHPNLESTVNQSINKEMFRKFEQMAEETLHLNNLVMQKLDVIDDMTILLNLIYDKREVDDLERKEIKIIKILEKFKELKPKKIVDYTNINIDDVVKIISNKLKFKLNSNTGSISLR